VKIIKSIPCVVILTLWLLWIIIKSRQRAPTL